jgi:putative transcriptional regulator
MSRLISALLLAVPLSVAAPLHAEEDVSQPMILVAKPELADPVYARTVLVVAPLGSDQHIGFIVNRPTEVTLGQLFPDDGPSQNVADPVYLGGPNQPGLVFALVKRASSPGGKSLSVLPGLYAAVDEKTVDTIIRADARMARFVAGFVAWQEGELHDEIEAGAWYVLAPDPQLVLDQPAESLWQELVRRVEAEANAI